MFKSYETLCLTLFWNLGKTEKNAQKKHAERYFRVFLTMFGSKIKTKRSAGKTCYLLGLNELLQMHFHVTVHRTPFITSCHGPNESAGWLHLS